MTTRHSEISRVDIYRQLFSQQHGSSARNEQESLLDQFLNDFPKTSRLRYERPSFERVFGTADLEDIRDGKFDHTDQHVAWLHDVDEDNQPRDYNGLMSVMQLHQCTGLKVCGLISDDD